MTAALIALVALWTIAAVAIGLELSDTRAARRRDEVLYARWTRTLDARWAASPYAARHAR